MVEPRTHPTIGCTVADSMVKAMQLIGSLMLMAAATTALVWYFVLWPFDKARS